MNRLRNKTIFLTILAAIQSVMAFSQQDPQFSQNMFNHMAVNPGFAGSQGLVNATMMNRQQWIGFEGNPQTTMVSINAPINPFGIRSGVGFLFMDDRLGFEKNTTLMASYAYRMEIGSGNLGIGLNLGLLNKTLDAKWYIPDSDLHSSHQQDPAIPEEQISGMVFDLGAGIFYNTDRFHAGISALHLLQPKVDYGDGAFQQMYRHYYASVGYVFKLPDPLFEIQPSLFVKSDGVSYQADINTLVIYNKKYWGGVSYRLGDAVVVMAGLELTSGIRAGIAYDFTTSAIAGYSRGSAEFMLGYNLEVSTEKYNQRYRSVRFL
ncbi:MAG: type IX secretion system membrane protein PorP/SprF [Bacteroidales bacterium]|nr:type IX secretion system membrane protein PorP/SprF [Bacteroidales bacterium]MDD2570636.1 type IX secretion system membrane protein PorP/SprF [Bacteroidales bacterium]MDD2812906.1 type IX secretion system membrane protein PorP/SprF [Bacteroidales bacterium]MDD3384666.1 type IX secretion system membrane protein PorP/SprF [Bacteroidales bacterium]MDD3810781.1 type IX secretion system membrane protein PorP/SprF [Bacteroidales bacterium]